MELLLIFLYLYRILSLFLEMHVEILRSEIYNVQNLLSNSLDKNCVGGAGEMK